jgi:hypothetical protein
MTKSKRKSSTRYFLILGIALIVLGAVFTLNKKRPTPQPIGINEVVSTGTVSLSFGPASAPLIKDSVSTLPITIDTAISKVTAASFAITYDPTKVTITGVTKGSFLTNTLVDPVIANGKATFTYSVPTGAGTEKQGTGTVAILSIKPLTTTPFTLSFDTGTLVAAISPSGNVLKVASATTLTPLSPVDGGWSNWSTKDTTCGVTGTQTRTCTNPAPLHGGSNCSGSSTQSYSNDACPIPGDFTDTGDTPSDQVNIYDYNKLVIYYANPYTIFDYNDIIANYSK